MPAQGVRSTHARYAWPITLGLIAQGLAPCRAADPPKSLPTLEMLPPGVVVGDGPPAGWSRLALKTLPRLASGDLDSLPSSAQETATTFRTVVLANVRRSTGLPARFGLDKIGLGLCVLRGREDVIVSPEADLDRLGIKLGAMQSIVLDSAWAQLKTTHLVARSPTFAIIDAPTTLAKAGKHREGILRYAFVVDPRTGALDVAVWPIAAEAKGRAPTDSVIVLPPSLTCEAPIDVSSTKILGEIPVSWSFGLAGLPSGRSARLPADLAASASRDPARAADVVALERGLGPIVSTTKAPRRP